jgi:NADH dehydrogenase, FAD-containing subunit
MDIGDHEVAYLAQAHWHGFRFRIGRMTGLDRSTREVHVAPFVDEDGAEVTPARSFPYDTLVMAVGSQSNDFGTPGVREHALKLETVADARRFHMRMVNACVRATPSARRCGRSNCTWRSSAPAPPASNSPPSCTTPRARWWPTDWIRVDADKDIRLALIEAAPRVLPALPERLSQSTERLLRKLGVEVHTRPRWRRCSPTAFAWPMAASCLRSWWCGRQG